MDPTLGDPTPALKSAKGAGIWAKAITRRPKSEVDAVSQINGDHARFREALDALEGAASEPIVPGEAGDWSASAETMGEAFDQAWSVYRARMKDMLTEIQENDLSLQPRVLELREGTRRLESRWAELKARISDAKERSDRVSDQGEGDLARQVQSDLSDWTVEARELDSAATTWLIESVYRERGVVD